MDQTWFFLSALLSTLPNNVYFYIWHRIDEKRSKCQYFLGPHAIQDAYNFVIGNNQIGDLYIGVTASVREIDTYHRPKKDDCAGIFTLWADIDLAHQAHKKNKDGKLPVDNNQVWELLVSVGIMPSLIVSSGHGYHVWYLLDRYFPRTMETAPYIDSLMSALQKKLQNNKWGYTVDSVFDLARILRIAGTTNRKQGYEAAPVQLVSYNELQISTEGLTQLKRHSIEEWANCLGVNLSGNIQAVNPTLQSLLNTLAGIPIQASVISTPSVIPVTQPIVSTTPISSTGTTRIPAGIPDQAPSISTPATVIPTVSPTPYPGLNILPPAIPTHAPVIPTVAPVIQTTANVPTQSPVSVPPASLPTVTHTIPAPVGQVTTQQPPELVTVTTPTNTPVGAPFPPFAINPNASPDQAAFDKLYAKERFRLSWERQRTDLRDNSSSGYDQSLANFSVYAGWSDQEVVNLLIAYHRKWNEGLKAVNYYQRTLATARAGAAEREANPKLILDVGSDYSTLVNTTLRVLLAQQQEEQLFLYSELGVVRVESNTMKERVVIVPVGTKELTGHIMKYINYIRTGKNGSRTTSPPVNVISTITGLPTNELTFRPLRRIVDSPVLLNDGRILTTPGYDKDSQLFYEPKRGFSAIGSIENPSAEDINRACSLLGELICDFAFKSEADRTNCVAMFLTPFLRELTPLVPLALVNAPLKGSGKTLLCDITAELATGSGAFKMGGRLPTEDELKKILTAVLMDGYTIVIIDNVASELKLDALASVLTAIGWTGRILGVSKIFQCENRLTFLANGNNLSVGSDMDRRAYEIRLESRHVNPSRRNSDEFLHSDIRAWVKDNRADLVKAILILIRAWVLAGRPLFKGVNLGSFESWVQITGGILGNAGYQGFLGNLEEMYNRVRSDDSDDGEVFLKAVLQCKWGNIFTVSEICAFITSGTQNLVKDALPVALQQKSGTSLSTALGVFFKSFQGRRFQSGEKVYYLASPGKDSGNARIWQFFENPVQLK